MSPRPVSELERMIGYTFKDAALLQEALTHSSVKKKQNYERLEFLGDRVLGLVIAELLYKRFPEESEGDLARRQSSLVQGATVAQLSARISLADFVVLSESEREAGGAEKENILADVYEAVIGAIYIDGGLPPCQSLIGSQWSDVLGKMVRPPQHPKTQVQEWAQGRGLSLPVYEVVRQSGPDHAPVFEVRIIIEGFPHLKAEGRSRQDAEKIAARLFIEKHISKKIEE